MALESKNVFIDTSLIVKNNFQFTFGRLQQLRDLAKSKRISIYLSDIVVQEVRKKIKEKVEEAERGYKKFRKEAMILKNLDRSPSALPATLSESTMESLMKQFDEFMSDCNVRLLSAGEIKAERVLDRFFKEEPPFGKGKKSSEFRDAFNMEVIRQWVNDRGEAIYVLAGDSDLEAACENEPRITYIKEIEDYLRLVNEKDNPKEAARVNAVLPVVYEQLVQALTEDFPKLEFFLEDKDGEVDGIKVNNVQLVLWPLNFSKGAVTVDFMAAIDYSADVVYDDPDLTYYDKEEDEHIVLKRIKATLDREAKVPGQVFISIDYSDLANISLNKIDLEERQISVAVDTSEYPYK